MNDRLGLVGCFAGLAAGESARRDAATGEIRIPLAVYAVEGRLGDLEFVLSRPEAESLHTWLARALAARDLPNQLGPARPARPVRSGAAL
jgi:hypothetical protein